jgi:hypothetical protein
LLNGANLDYGMIIGSAELVDVVDKSKSRWFRGPYGWLLRNPKPLAKPIFSKGKLGIWTIKLPRLRTGRRKS